MSNPVRNWYPFYLLDYRSDTRFLSDDADLLYRRMLDLYWETRGELYVKDLRSIAKLTGYQWRKFKRSFEELSDKFPEVRGKLVNKRMDIEIDKAIRNHEVAVKNGRIGGRKNTSNSLSNGPSETKAIAEALNGSGQGKGNSLNTLDDNFENTIGLKPPNGSAEPRGEF